MILSVAALSSEEITDMANVEEASPEESAEILEMIENMTEDDQEVVRIERLVANTNTKSFQCVTVFNVENLTHPPLRGTSPSVSGGSVCEEFSVSP